MVEGTILLYSAKMYLQIKRGVCLPHLVHFQETASFYQKDSSMVLACDNHKFHRLAQNEDDNSNSKEKRGKSMKIISNVKCKNRVLRML